MKALVGALALQIKLHKAGTRTLHSQTMPDDWTRAPSSKVETLIALPASQLVSESSRIEKTVHRLEYRSEALETSRNCVENVRALTFLWVFLHSEQHLCKSSNRGDSFVIIVVHEISRFKVVVRHKCYSYHMLISSEPHRPHEARPRWRQEW